MSARELLKHPFLRQSDEYSVWMSKDHLKEFKIVNLNQFPGYIEKLRQEKKEEAERKEKEEAKRL